MSNCWYLFFNGINSTNTYQLDKALTLYERVLNVYEPDTIIPVHPPVRQGRLISGPLVLWPGPPANNEHNCMVTVSFI